MKSSRGLTMIELACAVAVSSIVALGVSMLYRVGIESQRQAYRTTVRLRQTALAFDGDSVRPGMLRAAREATSVVALDATRLRTTTPTWDFQLASTKLTRSGSQQATGVTSLDVKYYNLDSNGRVIESTAAASAAMVTTAVTFTKSNGKTAYYFGGSRLWNR